MIDTDVDSREDPGERRRDIGTDTDIGTDIGADIVAGKEIDIGTNIAIEVEGYEVSCEVVEAYLKKSASV